MSQTPVKVGKDAQETKEMQTYDKDFYQWTIEQAQALQGRKLEALDWDNLTKEIESLNLLLLLVITSKDFFDYILMAQLILLTT